MKLMKMREFLALEPPGGRNLIVDLEIRDRSTNLIVNFPEIEIHCATCNGLRFFHCQMGPVGINDRTEFNVFISYTCRNCRKQSKVYAVGFVRSAEPKGWFAKKFGEEPVFGPPVPSRAISLIGPDRELFLKGRRCENLGLGIGAFVYYRRVVESQKSRIFDEIIRVSRHLNVDGGLIAELEEAKSEVQFTTAVDSIKAAIPQSLQINGYNPLLLLHSALSRGVHELTDTECAEIAGSIRVILVELAERLAAAMKNEAELNDAVNKLANRRKS